jgi:hypothetical protein
MRAERFIIGLVILLALLGCNSLTPSRRLAKAEEEIRTAKDDYWRLHPLGKAGMACVDLERLDQAQRYAEELFKLSDSLYPEKGDADSIHHGNLILGRIALRQGDLEKAKSYLLKAGKVESSPVLGSFGPNRSLAKELLEKKERDVVLEYFKLCESFWEMGKDEELKIWTDQVRAGKVPDFRANLYH